MTTPRRRRPQPRPPATPHDDPTRIVLLSDASRRIVYHLRMITSVLLPGMDGTGVLFADFVASLPPEFKPLVVAYPNDPKLGYPELEVLARAALPRDQRFILLGESFSGPVAISIAASNPPGLLGLILCCTFARSPHPLLAQLSFSIEICSTDSIRPVFAHNWRRFGTSFPQTH
jgi:pimeloyl-ACP methyl ester carboxylesterase